MAKRTRKPPPLNLENLHRVAQAASELGVNNSTLWAAINRDEIPSYITGCGCTLVTLADVARWQEQADTRKPGRKPGTPHPSRKPTANQPPTILSDPAPLPPHPPGRPIRKPRKP